MARTGRKKSIDLCSFVIFDPLGGFYNVEKLRGDEAGTANEKPVYSRDFKISCGVGGFYAAAKEDGSFGGDFGAEGGGEGGTDEIDYLRDSVRGGGSRVFRAGDGPNWFVGDDDVFDFFLRDFAEAREKLVADNIGGFAVFAFFGGFADAKNRGQTVAKGGGDL